MENVEKETKNLIGYIIAVVSEFATSRRLSQPEAFRYLERYRGIDFVRRFYDVEHTLPFEDVVEDLAAYCRRKGGALA